MIMIMIIIVVIKHFVRRILSVLELNSRRYFVVKEMNSVEMPKEIVVSTLTRNVCEERADSSRGGDYVRRGRFVRNSRRVNEANNDRPSSPGGIRKRRRAASLS